MVIDDGVGQVSDLIEYWCPPVALDIALQVLEEHHLSDAAIDTDTVSAIEPRLTRDDMDMVEVWLVHHSSSLPPSGFPSERRDAGTDDL